MSGFDVIVSNESETMERRGPDPVCPNVARCNGICGDLVCGDVVCSVGACKDTGCEPDSSCGDPMCDFDIGCNPNCGSEDPAERRR